jgi:hypothetical protein
LIRIESGLSGIGRKYLMILSLELPLMTVITYVENERTNRGERKKETEETKEEEKCGGR